MFRKRFFFISKELQLIRRITVNRVVPCTSETRCTNSSVLLKKKNPQGKRREKRKQGARLVEALKSHITQIQNFISGKLQSPQRITKSFFTYQKITISKVVLHISKNYNQQSHSSHQSTPSQGKNHKKGKEKEKEKGKEKENEKEKKRRRRKRKRGMGRKEGRTGIMDKAGLKSFPFEAYRPLRIRSPVQFHQWAELWNNITPTAGKLGKNKTPTNSKVEKPSAGP